MKLDRFRQETETPALPLTPLVDVLFLMIIFLVLGASFDQVETVRLPEASGSPSQETAVLRLELHPDGRLRHEGRPVPDGEVLGLIRRRAPAAVLLLPDQEARVGPLIRWYDRIGGALGIPVQIGVRPPAP